MSTEDDQDEAIGRLGGPSKIAKLEKDFAEAVVRLEQERLELKTKVEEQLQIARVTAGAQLGLGNDYHNWYGGHPSGTCTVIAIGFDWCVVRNDKGEVFCKLCYDVRQDLGCLLVPSIQLL